MFLAKILRFRGLAKACFSTFLELTSTSTFVVTGTVSISGPKVGIWLWITVCHFEMASLGPPIEAPVGRAFANSQLITFSFTLSFLPLSKNFSRVASFFLQQTLWRNHEMEWDRVHILWISKRLNLAEITYVKLWKQHRLEEEMEKVSSSFWSYCTSTVPLSNQELIDQDCSAVDFLQTGPLWDNKYWRDKAKQRHIQEHDHHTK